MSPSKEQYAGSLEAGEVSSWELHQEEKLGDEGGGGVARGEAGEVDEDRMLSEPAGPGDTSEPWSGMDLPHAEACAG